MKDYSKVVNCYIFTAKYSDFVNKDCTAWQKSYFELLSWKNTWNLAYDLDILSNKSDGAFLRLVTKATESMKERMLQSLEELGYRNVSVDEVKARIFDPYDIWPDDFDNEIYEYYEG